MVTAIRTCRSAWLPTAALGQVSLVALVGWASFACKGERPRISAVADALPAQVHAGQPSIDFDARVHDFGVVNEGPKVTHVFKIKNKGTAPLALSGASASCGCTSATLDATTILPGGSGALSVVMDTHGEKGKGTRSITVYSDDPTQPEAGLEIKYDVERLLKFEQSYLHLSMRPGARRAKTAWLTGDLLAAATPRVVSVTPKGTLRARVVRTRESGQPRKGLTIELHDRNRRSGEGTVVVETGLCNPPELRLSIQYAVE